MSSLVVQALSDGVWLLMRIQSDGPDDFANVRQLHQQFRIEAPEVATVIPYIPAALATATDADVPTPRAIMTLNGATYFSWASNFAAEMNDANIPAENFESLGIAVYRTFDWESLASDQQAVLNGARDGNLRQLAMMAAREGGYLHNGWYYLFGNWYDVDGHHVRRQQPENYTLGAGLALEALGYLPPEEATYMSAGVRRVGGALLSGEEGRQWRIRFAADALPPAGAFWSATIYSDAGYLVENALNRFSLGSKDDLLADADGSVTVAMAAERPFTDGDPQNANWLPIPPGHVHRYLSSLYAYTADCSE